MPSFAKIELMGHVGRVDTLQTKNGKTMYKISIAVNRKQGNEQLTDWFTVVSMQEWIEDNVFKGDLVLVEGVPSFSKGNDGRQFLNIWANRLYKLRGPGQTTMNDEPIDIPF